MAIVDAMEKPKKPAVTLGAPSGWIVGLEVTTDFSHDGRDAGRRVEVAARDPAGPEAAAGGVPPRFKRFRVNRCVVRATKRRHRARQASHIADPLALRQGQIGPYCRQQRGNQAAMLQHRARSSPEPAKHRYERVVGHAMWVDCTLLALRRTAPGQEQMHCRPPVARPDPAGGFKGEARPDAVAEEREWHVQKWLDWLGDPRDQFGKGGQWSLAVARPPARKFHRAEIDPGSRERPPVAVGRGGSAGMRKAQYSVATFMSAAKRNPGVNRVDGWGGVSGARLEHLLWSPPIPGTLVSNYYCPGHAVSRCALQTAAEIRTGSIRPPPPRHPQCCLDANHRSERALAETAGLVQRSFSRNIPR